jgi:pimeloyl-ACP methyl ester carboxylesterase
LAWVTGLVSIERIVLWGFSLGTYPVTYCASLHKVKGVILQSPIASIGCAFKHDNMDPDIEILNDYLVNLDYIHKIKC